MRQAFDGFQVRAADDPPSNLALVVDTAITSWSQTTDESSEDTMAQVTTTLKTVTEQLLIFINTFLLLHDANRLCIILTSGKTCKLVYPVLPDADAISPDYDASGENDLFEASSQLTSQSGLVEPMAVMQDVCDALVSGVKHSLQIQAMNTEQSHKSSMLSSGVARALCLLNRARKLRAERLAIRRGKDGAAVDASDVEVPANGRVFIIQAGADSVQNYVAMMNCIFSAQRLGIPIDSCVFANSDSTYLQQAAHLTQGVCQRITQKDHAIFLQWLQTTFLTDLQSRDFVSMPAPQSVDFRACCMQTRKIIEDGYTCSVCLSTFDSSVAKGTAMCAVCNARFAVPSRGRRRPPRPA